MTQKRSRQKQACTVSAEAASLLEASSTSLSSLAVTASKAFLMARSHQASQPTGLPQAMKPGTARKLSLFASASASWAASWARKGRMSTSHLGGCTRMPEPSMALVTSATTLKAGTTSPTM